MPTSDDTPTAQDTKDKFRQALERKKRQQHPHDTAPHADSTTHGAAGPAGGKREFRRKSGG